MKRFILLTFLATFLCISNVFSQQKPPTEYGSGLTVSLNDDGSKYFRLVQWNQFWLTFNDATQPDGSEQFTATPMLRRVRLLMYAQLTDRFMIVTHFGLNNLRPSGLDPTGQSSQAQLFFHDAYVEYKIIKQLYIGGGLHYWNGISRLNNTSSLSMLTLDNARHAWASLGTSDQFARHLGMYAKGKIGKLDYRIAWNGAMVNSVDANKTGYIPNDTAAIYVGRQQFGTSASNVFAGYVNYQFWDQESNKLPYFTGTYLGTKKIFNIGAGFYSHANGSVIAKPTVTDPTNVEGQNVLIWSVDAFFELPVGEKHAAISAYLQYQSNNYGSNYQLAGSSQSVFTGNVIYLQGGFLLPNSKAVAWQPYINVTQKDISALDGSATDFGIGINSLITGHHAKISLEYRTTGLVNTDSRNSVILQAQIFL